MGVEEQDFNGVDLTHLKLDEAFVDITNPDDKNYLYLRSDDCYKCPFRPFDQFFYKPKVRKWNEICSLIDIITILHPIFMNVEFESFDDYFTGII